MKTKVVIVILAVVCAGLAIALFAARKQAEAQRQADQNSIVDFSNQVVNASLKITDLNQVNLALTNDLAASRQQTAEFSNNLATTATALAVTSDALTASKGELADAQNQITNLNTRVSDLEIQNKTLEQRAAELAGSINELNLQIEATRQKLATSESGNAFLQQELQRQMAQKAELEHKFNDLDALRQQVKKIKTDIFVARRLQFMKNDNSQKKGAELLLQRNVPAPESAPSSSLNVEVGSDGSVRVIPPLGAGTNSAAH